LANNWATRRAVVFRLRRHTEHHLKAAQKLLAALACALLNDLTADLIAASPTHIPFRQADCSQIRFCEQGGRPLRNVCGELGNTNGGKAAPHFVAFNGVVIKEQE